MSELRRRKLIERNTVHGLRYHPLYQVWLSMKARCYNKKDKSYKFYGKNGISIYNPWKNDFKIFYDWSIANGYKKGLSIDRKENNGNYEPGNCRYTDNTTQAINRKKFKTNTSNYVGITFHSKNKNWTSRISYKRKRYYLGSFSSKKDAIKARNNYIINNKLSHKLQNYE